MTATSKSIPSQLLIGDSWLPAETGSSYTSDNHYSGEGWATVPDAGAADVVRAVAAARAALDGPCRAMTGCHRAGLMRRLAVLLARDARELAGIESRDNGKLLRQTLGQQEYLPAWLDSFAGVADKLQGDVIPSNRANLMIYTRDEAVGVDGAIVPWNSPLLLLMWKLAPALTASCVLVVKPSDSTTVSALELGKRVLEAGFLPGVFNVVTGRGPAVGQALVAYPDVDHIAFTGSTVVGKAVARDAAANFIRTVLELGGKSAQLVFDDVDLQAAANGVIAGIFAATGQTCIAGSRLLVHEGRDDELVQRISDRVATIGLGHPLDPDTEMGPLANATQLGAVSGFVVRAVQAGATLVCGGAQHLDAGPLALPAEHPDRCPRRDGTRPLGDLRAGPGGPAVHHRVGGHRAGQQHGVRPGCRCLDVRSVPRSPRGASVSRRHRLGHLLPGRRPRRAVRRGRIQRLGAREWP